MMADRSNDAASRRVFVLGGTGTIGRAAVSALLARGHRVVCFGRARPSGSPAPTLEEPEFRLGDVTDPASIARDGIRGEHFDVVLSCLASRTGAPDDAWRIDHDAHVGILRTAEAAGIGHMILLSAICVQKPVLAFQKAKLAFEQKLMESGLDYTIVRPTAFFKSLSGQVDRVKRGKPFLVFGNGELTACKPISNRDLGAYIAECIDDPQRRNRVLPIGGPGDPITPRMQGEALFALTGQPARFTRVPVFLLDSVIATLATLGRVAPSLRAKAELARIGRYYATQSMLVLDPATGRYSASSTPSTGTDTLFDHYARLLSGEADAERGDHAVF